MYLSAPNTKAYIEFAKKRGYATRDELRLYLPMNVTAEELEEVASMLAEMGIAVIGKSEALQEGAGPVTQLRELVRRNAMPPVPAERVPFTPSMPNITELQSTRRFQAGPYVILLFKNARSFAASAGGPSLIRYPFTMAVLERAGDPLPVHLVTLETSVFATNALCSFDRHGNHLYFAGGQEPDDEASFVTQALGLIRTEFGIEVVEQVRPS
jgi:hypothetical protein